MKECCDTCRLQKKLIKYDYSQRGCIQFDRWSWIPCGDNEEKILDKAGRMIASLTKSSPTTWRCSFRIDSLYLRHEIKFVNVKSLDEARKMATLWINNQCSIIIDAVRNIADHLPLINELSNT